MRLARNWVRCFGFKIWKKAIEIGDKLLNIADDLEKRKLYRFADQVPGASLSISNNIAEGRIVFYNGDILECTESITPNRFRYRYHYMTAGCGLIFRYDNVPHHSEISTFPHYKHVPDKIVKNSPVNLKEVVEEIIEIIVS